MITATAARLPNNLEFVKKIIDEFDGSEIHIENDLELKLHIPNGVKVLTWTSLRISVPIFGMIVAENIDAFSEKVSNFNPL